jgi:hypothetical protein
MSGRPEGTDGGYHEIEDDYHHDAWQEFTPWRPGDPSTAGEAPPGYAANGAEFDGQRSVPAEPDRNADCRDEADERRSNARSGRWWTEEVPERYKPGDRVRSVVTITGRLGFSHVSADTRGQVVSTRLGMLGGEYATVQFENGYTEEIETSAIERRSWWD